MKIFIASALCFCLFLVTHSKKNEIAQTVYSAKSAEQIARYRTSAVTFTISFFFLRLSPTIIIPTILFPVVDEDKNY